MAPCARVLGNWTSTSTTTGEVSCLHFMQLLVGLPTSTVPFEMQDSNLHCVGLPTRYNCSQSFNPYHRTGTFGLVEGLVYFLVAGSPELVFHWLVAASLGVWGCAVALLLLLPTEYHEGSPVRKAARTKPLKSRIPRCPVSRFVGSGRGRLCVVQSVKTVSKLCGKGRPKVWAGN